MNEGVVKCWGAGLNGRTGHANLETIGDNETANSANIVNLSTIPAVQLAVGGAHNCVLLDDGHVRCWGTGADGRLGYENDDDIGDDEDPISAGHLPGIKDAVQITAGQKHSCALLGDGSVSCWGSNNYGQLGSGPTAFPLVFAQNIDLGAPAVEVVAGDYHTCAILDTGELLCWGLGSMGRLGYGNTNSVGLLQTPREAGPVSLGGVAVSVAAGTNHTCAITADASLRCWGRGSCSVALEVVLALAATTLVYSPKTGKCNALARPVMDNSGTETRQPSETMRVLTRQALSISVGRPSRLTLAATTLVLYW
jgi:alpha-tubulin suppressor-like RCC1 family protein